jgi:hypothetical protein
MRLAGLVGMTGSTGVARTRGDYTGYCCFRCVTKLASCLCIGMTRITVTGFEVMQRDNLAPGADRIMTARTTRAVSYLVSNAVVISYVMTGGSSMDRMTVKISCMTVRAVTLDNRGCVSTR